MTQIVTLAPGYRRQWVRCKECHKASFYDYIPYSLSNPIMTLPCGHGLGQRFGDSVTYITETEAIVHPDVPLGIPLKRD